MGERLRGKQEVGGSIPPSSTNNSLKRLDFSGLFFFWISVWKDFGNILEILVRYRQFSCEERIKSGAESFFYNDGAPRSRDSEK